MALTVRLSPKTERALNALAKRRRPYGAWLDVLGVVTLGARDPARTAGEQFTAILRRQNAEAACSLTPDRSSPSANR